MIWRPHADVAAEAPPDRHRVTAPGVARTWKCVRVNGPNDVMRATSTASRPRPDDDPADPRHVVPGIERVPAATEIGFEPDGEVHRVVRDRNVDVGDVAEHVPGGDVQRPTERDGEVGEVAAHTLLARFTSPAVVHGFDEPGGELEVAVHEIHDGLDAMPSRRHVAEALPRLVPELVGEQNRLGITKCRSSSGSSITGTSTAFVTIASGSGEHTTTASYTNSVSPASIANRSHRLP